MIEPALPPDETARLAALHELRILDTPAEERFDRITRIARDLFGTPITLVSLVDADRQWFKSRVGLDASATPRTVSFCGHAILSDRVFVVEDAAADPRFADNPLVTGPPHIRFYAGAPLRSTLGHRLGTLCLIDSAPRRFAEDDARRLADLAAWAESELNLSTRIDQAIGEMRDTFVRLVSHELRTPATGIVGALELLRSGIVSGTDIDALVRVAADSASQLSRVVDEIVEIAEIDARQLDLTPSPIELPVFVDAALDSFAATANRLGVTWDVRAEPGLTIQVAPKPLARILRTLIDNALGYSPSGGKISITVNGLDDTMVRIRIVDQGPGVPMNHIPRLFQPFVQAEASDNRTRNGFGAGLAVAWRLAMALGGRLGYEPQEVSGSCFRLDLPR